MAAVARSGARRAQRYSSDPERDQPHHGFGGFSTSNLAEGCDLRSGTDWITRPARCAKSSTVQVARGSTRIIPRRGSAALPISLAADKQGGAAGALRLATARSLPNIANSRTA
jgi:hypothetical protein